jgi:hypothetical protein
MNRNASESAVDRLIALASDEKPAKPAPPAHAPAAAHAHAYSAAAVENPERPTELEPVPQFADIKDLEQNPMWKALLQFRVLVPYIARLLEVSTHSHTSAPAPASNELKQTVTDLQTTQRDLQTSQRDLRTAVQEQMVQMKRVEEDTARIRQASEKSATQTAELVEDIKAVHSLVKIMAGVFGGLLLVLIALVVFLLVKVH